MRISTFLLALSLIGISTAAWANTGEIRIPERTDWAYKGVRGTWDKAEIYRGYQVATQVCLACHSFKYVSHRDLMRVGFTENEVKALAKNLNMGVDDKLLTALSPDDAQATYGKVPPDLSLIARARQGGGDYLYALLTGYSEKPEVIKEYLPGGRPENAHFNLYFPGHAIAMPSPLGSAGLVNYTDGTDASMEQMAHDVVTFLSWTAEPERIDRQHLGVYVLLYLLIFVVLAYLTKRAIWHGVKH